MKRIFTLLIALLLIALPAFAEPMSLLDYTDDITESGCPIYYFPELSIQLPAEWAGKVMAMPGESSTAFYQIASYEKFQEDGLDGGGFLFSLCTCADDSYTELPAYEYLGYSEDSAVNYYLMLPTDYPAYMEDDIRAEYDAMHAQMDYVINNIAFYAGNVADDAQMTDGTGPNDAAEVAQEMEMESAGETAGEAASYTVQDVRYFFEHSALPRYFYEVPENMLDGLRDAGLYWLWEAIATENGVDPTYPAEDYVEHWYSGDDGTTVALVELPAPDANLLCYRIYFVYNADQNVTGYYTVETETMFGETALLCGWSQDQTHTVYGGAMLPDRGNEAYASNLLSEAQQVVELTGLSGTLSAE